MEQQPRPTDVPVALKRSLKHVKSSLALAARWTTWCTRQLSPGLTPARGRHTLVQPIISWRSGSTNIILTSTHWMRIIRGPHSVHMLEISKGTTSLSTSTGILLRELPPSTPSLKFAGSALLKNFTSSFIQRMLPSIRDQNSSPSVGTRNAISWQITRKLFKKIIMQNFHFHQNLQKLARATANGYSTISFLCNIFHFCILMYLYLCNLFNSFSNEQTFQAIQDI